jgi:hypothetical protein
MNASQIIKEIERLPLNKRMIIVERTIKSIRENKNKSKLKIGADALLTDYVNDPELTVFTDIDFEKFYETR